MKENLKVWIRNTMIKTLKTCSQAAIAYIGSATVISSVDWRVCASTVALAGIVCILMNIANLETE